MCPMRKFLLKLKAGTEELNYGRDILVRYAEEVAAGRSNLRILDIGLGSGTDLLNIQKRCASVYPDLKVELYGFECYPPNVERARQHGIHVVPGNVENERFPFDDGFFDIIVANQILEHTKELFWIFGEMSRVLKKGGYVLSGVPNLASFHNRVALMLGLQPTSIEVLGPHVRGFTAPSFVRFMETDGFFRNEAVKGSNFYPFPPGVSRLLSRWFPTMSVGIFFKTRRTEKSGNFIEVLKARFFETNFYAGEDTSESSVGGSTSF